MGVGTMLYFVVFREEDQWVAIGLQRTVIAYATTLRRLRENIELTLQLYREDESRSIERLPSAKAEYWEMFIAALEAGQTLEDLSCAESQAETYALKLAA